MHKCTLSDACIPGCQEFHQQHFGSSMLCENDDLQCICIVRDIRWQIFYSNTRYLTSFFSIEESTSLVYSSNNILKSEILDFKVLCHAPCTCCVESVYLNSRKLRTKIQCIIKVEFAQKMPSSTFLKVQSSFSKSLENRIPKFGQLETSLVI